jgi:hypothetical protein
MVDEVDVVVGADAPDVEEERFLVQDVTAKIRVAARQKNLPLARSFFMFDILA